VVLSERQVGITRLRTITVKIPSRLEARLRLAVARRRSTRSAVVREAIEAHVDAAQGGRAESSCLELAGDLAGALSGPPDLSSSRRRLRGYGR
jgi:Arc/MetJ-type ribon-helix-helix transcriptional regulator